MDGGTGARGQRNAARDALDSAVAAILESRFQGLRDYQRKGVEIYAARVRKTRAPLLTCLPTGSGKSHFIAAAAAVTQAMASAQSNAQKKVLILAPNGELVEQNCDKMRALGYSASIFATAAGAKEHAGDFIFANPETVRANLDLLLHYEWSLVIVDEAHRLSHQIKKIISCIQERNPNVRVLGLTATPYRLGSGYIYQQDTYAGTDPLGRQYARAPYFAELFYSMSPHDLIDAGYIVPPVFGTVDAHYDTSGLQRSNIGGAFTAQSEDRVFSVREITNAIAKEIKRSRHTEQRRSVMVFGQNIRHAKIILDALKSKRAALITHETPPGERRQIVERFRNRKLTYLVNVGTLTTGFDVPHVDMIAILRATESASLFQQIIGRGLRPLPGKHDCLVLDYAQNLARHCPDGDPFAPRIRAFKSADTQEFQMVEVRCPVCGGVQHFRRVAPPAGTEMDEHGYLVNSETGRSLTTRLGQPIAGHMGRRCLNRLPDAQGKLTRCTHTWASRECPSCGALNNAHDRYCTQCTTPLAGTCVCPQCNAENSLYERFCINCTIPLSKSAAQMRGRAHTSSQIVYNAKRADVLRMEIKPTTTRAGDPALRIDFEVQELPYLQENEDGEYELHTPVPDRVQIWLSPAWANGLARKRWRDFLEACLPAAGIASPRDLHAADPRIRVPAQITYRRQRAQSATEASRAFFEVLEYHGDKGHSNAKPSGRHEAIGNTLSAAQLDGAVDVELGRPASNDWKSA